MSDSLPQGVPYAVGAALFAALQADPAFVGAKLLDNPVRASTILDGARIVFLEDVNDLPGESNQQIKRVYQFNVGVINRSTEPRLGAHGDYRAAKRVINASIRALDGIVVATSLREGAVNFKLENIDVGAGLVLATFTVGYRDPDFRAV